MFLRRPFLSRVARFVSKKSKRGTPRAPDAVPEEIPQASVRGITSVPDHKVTMTSPRIPKILCSPDTLRWRSLMLPRMRSWI